MSDLISRQAAIDALIELYEYQRDIDPTEAADLVRQGIYLAEKKIEQLPSAQPERKRGKWIDEGFYADGHGAHAFRCSECGGHIIEYDADPFCRWCGAYMRGEQDG